jgi:hypothetical protein
MNLLSPGSRGAATYGTNSEYSGESSPFRPHITCPVSVGICFSLTNDSVSLIFQLFRSIL